LALFDHLTIASRPASRRASQEIDFDNLRAIPFVAAWSILKIQIPGFYGLGIALEQMLQAGREADLRRLYRSSRFFRALLDNAAMSLLKSRFDITAHLSRDEQVGQLWQKVREEARRVEHCILRVAEQPRLLANDPMIRASIRFREDIVLPLLVIVHDSFARFNGLSRLGRADCEEAVLARKMALKGMAAVVNATRNAA
jgi:phosphoenolpyruvate carboxylase